MKDIYFIYHGSAVVAKVQVYKIGREAIFCQIMESTGAPETGDEVKRLGVLAQAQPIDMESYEKLVYPIFSKSVIYGYTFAQSTANFFTSMCNMNDPRAIEQLSKDLQQAGSDNWWNFIHKFRANFTNSDIRKTFREGDVFLAESFKKLKAVKPPEAAEKSHLALLGYTGRLQVIFSAFKDIPEDKGTNSDNYIVRLHNRFFVKENMLDFTKNVMIELTKVCDQYLKLFPEWKDKDPRDKFKKNV